MKALSPDAIGAEVGRLLAPLPVIRALRPDDRALVDALVRDLSPTSRYRRFHAAVNGLPASMLERLSRVDARDEVALLATTTARGTEVAVGEARYARDELGSDAREFALVVVEPWQRLGVGTRLLRELMRQAARSGVGVLYGDMITDNAPMLALARQLGFERRRHPFDARLVRLTWTPADSVDGKPTAEQRETAGGQRT